MADVLIVCVREDEPQAKALADMFEAAGFSIGGAPSNDGSLRSSGAGVIVWSRSSIRSRPFLDAAQRVMNAGKGVVASLIEPPPPSSVGDSPTFDLSAWAGDADDPQLDPLFFAVDRMVNTARASVGAGSGMPAPPPFEPPQSLRPPPASPPRVVRPNPMAQPASPSIFQNKSGRGENLNSEAEHWRAIRDSKNPSDFMDYISRYGADGAFTEVAELRLKQLTAQQPAAPLRNPARPPVDPGARPMGRQYDAPQRRMEPGPTRRPEVGARLPGGYDRVGPREVRDSTRQEGGALRAIVIVAVLSAIALAGGLYFGRDRTNASPPAEEIAATTPPAAYDDPIEPADGIALNDLASIQPNDRRPAAPAARPAAARPAAATPARPSAASPADNITPPPVSSFSTPPSGGPVSLVPGGDTPAGTNPAATSPTEAPPETDLVSQLASLESRPIQAPPATVLWAQRPSARVISANYPPRALREGVSGRAVLDCLVQPGLNLACTVASETPASSGFGRAALTAASAYRAQPTRSDGSSSVGARTRVAFSFQAPD